MLNHPPGVSKRIGVILEVLQAIRLASPTNPNDVVTVRKDAQQAVADRRGFRTVTTVHDACCRQLDLHMDQFDDLVLQWLVARDERLKNLLSAHAAHARQADLDAISRFFQGPPSPPDPPVNRVEAPTPDRGGDTATATTQPYSAIRDLNNAVEDLSDYLCDQFWRSASAILDSLPVADDDETIARARRAITPPAEAKLNVRRWLAAALRHPEIRTRICEQALQIATVSLRKDAPAPPAPAPVCFGFTVNRSFQNYHSHRITIPMHSVSQLLDANLLGPNRVLAPDGTTFLGHIFASATHGNPYWQLTTSGGRPGDVLARMPIGTRLTVEISRVEGRVQVRL